MQAQVAVRLALDLVHVPSRIRNTRSEPLPEGVRILLQIAAGDQEALFNAAKLVDRTEDEIRAAAAFFIEQVLLAPDADSYRILGASPHASAAELRQNMVLLMRWLHPDIHSGGPQRVLACRVTGAWDTIKTAERRLAYDQSLNEREATKPRRSRKIKRRPTAKHGRRRRRPKLVQQNYQPRELAVYRDGAMGILRRALWPFFRRRQQ